MHKVLLTAFEPFGTDVENSSALVLEQIKSRREDCVIAKRILPVEFRAGREAGAGYLSGTGGRTAFCHPGESGGQLYGCADTGQRRLLAG